MTIHEPVSPEAHTPHEATPAEVGDMHTEQAEDQLTLFGGAEESTEIAQAEAHDAAPAVGSAALSGESVTARTEPTDTAEQTVQPATTRTDENPGAKGKKNKGLLAVAGGTAAAVALGVLGYAFLGRSNNEDSSAAPAPSVSASATPTETSSPTPTPSESAPSPTDVPSSASPTETASNPESDKVYSGIPLSMVQAEVASQSQIDSLVQQFPELKTHISSLKHGMETAGVDANGPAYLKDYKAEQKLAAGRTDLGTLPTMPNVLDVPPASDVTNPIASAIGNFQDTISNNLYSFLSKPNADNDAMATALIKVNAQDILLRKNIQNWYDTAKRDASVLKVTPKDTVSILDYQIEPNGQLIIAVLFDYKQDDGSEFVQLGYVAPYAVPTAIGITPSSNPDTAFPLVGELTTVLDTRK